MNKFLLNRMLVVFRNRHMLRFQSREDELLAGLAWELFRICEWKGQSKKRLEKTGLSSIQRTRFILWGTQRVDYFVKELNKIK